MAQRYGSWVRAVLVGCVAAAIGVGCQRANAQSPAPVPETRIPMQQPAATQPTRAAGAQHAAQNHHRSNGRHHAARGGGPTLIERHGPRLGLRNPRVSGVRASTHAVQRVPRNSHRSR